MAKISRKLKEAWAEAQARLADNPSVVAIVSEDGFLGALLFAGGSGVTVANQISHVVSPLGVRL